MRTLGWRDDTVGVNFLDLEKLQARELLSRDGVRPREAALKRSNITEWRDIQGKYLAFGSNGDNCWSLSEVMTELRSQAQSTPSSGSSKRMPESCSGE